MRDLIHKIKKALQGLAPVNFKNEPYQDEIACVADNVDQFAKLKRCRQSSRQLSKAPSTSRYWSSDQCHTECVVATHNTATCDFEPHMLLILK